MKKTVLTMIATICLLSLVLVACGNDDKESSSDTTKSTAAMEEKKSVGEIAMADDSFSTLVDLVVATGLDEVLQGEGTYTVFAPSNDAFAKVDPATLAALQANKDALKQVLTYHVLDTTVLAADLEDGAVVTTVEGSELTIGVDGDKVTVTDDNGNTYNVTKADITGSNGVIHVIDGVLVPMDLKL